jgi:alpha-tubulin suppressor-like RCC1 family protein
MPTFYNFRQDGVAYSFDDIFVPADLFRTGNLWTWGRGTSGQLGNNTTITRSTPSTITISGGIWKQITCGGYHTAAVKTDGTLWTWGINANGQLGDFTTSTKSVPSTTFIGGTDWRQVSANIESTAAVKTDGTLWTWGLASNGQLGTNDTTIRSTPTTTFVGGTNWKEVSVGGLHMAAIKTDGTLWTWGLGSSGQLGTNNTSIISTPVTTFVGGTDWKQVSSGNSHTVAIKTDGTLWTWGLGSNVRLGTNDSTTRSTPTTTFVGGTDWKQVSSGNSHTAAIKTDGTLWTWGLGTSAQLGINDNTSRSTPVTTFIGGTTWKKVSSGNSHTSAVKTDGTLWAWGNNSDGQLGINNLTNRSTPVTTLVGGTSWKEVTCGEFHTVAILYDDSVL